MIYGNALAGFRLVVQVGLGPDQAALLEFGTSLFVVWKVQLEILGVIKNIIERGAVTVAADRAEWPTTDSRRAPRVTDRLDGDNASDASKVVPDEV